MTKLHLLSTEERSLFFRSASDKSLISFEIIEKDFWVVWMLERIFSLKDLQSHLTFKGGTSLSKVYGVIQRFSEDIDVSIEKGFFGFDDVNDPEKAISKKKQRASIEQLAEACSAYVRGRMLDDLKSNIVEILGSKIEWDLVIDPEDPDGQTLLFEYPTEASREGYIRPFVKIEMGARSEHWPVSQHSIQSYAKSMLNDKIEEAKVLVKVLNIERTFWEKATILHQYAHLPEGRSIPPRISRHFYDFYCLLRSDFKEKALAQMDLLERVAIHKSIYFPSGWSSYGTARRGTLKLSPQERSMNALRDDFRLMTQMFLGEIPDWGLILKSVAEFEREFNSGL